MATSVLQIRVDDNLKAQASALYEELGLDLPTAIRMFLKRSVMVNGIPFGMTLEPKAFSPTKAAELLNEIRTASALNGAAALTLDEINAEIAAARSERDAAGV